MRNYYQQTDTLQEHEQLNRSFQLSNGNNQCSSLDNFLMEKDATVKNRKAKPD